MGTQAKRGRWRPYTTVPLSSINHPCPLMRHDKETPNQAMVEEYSSKCIEKPIEEVMIKNETLEDEIEIVEDETLELESKVDPENRKLWLDVLSENRNPTKGLPMECVTPSAVNGEVEIEI
ncbi:unnamed protein product [Lathyrus sativus]|nr:unnamed protein product [Lathyrus sativus]